MTSVCVVCIVRKLALSLSTLLFCIMCHRNETCPMWYSQRGRNSVMSRFSWLANIWLFMLDMSLSHTRQPTNVGITAWWNQYYKRRPQRVWPSVDWVEWTVAFALHHTTALKWSTTVMTEPVTATETETSLDAHGKLVTIRINELHTLICVFGNKSEKKKYIELKMII